MRHYFRRPVSDLVVMLPIQILADLLSGSAADIVAYAWGCSGPFPTNFN
jgi:hypothetical protein